MKLLFLLMLMILLHGCDSENSNAGTKSQSSSEPQVEKIKVEPEKFTYQMEDVNHSSHYDQARVQFLWKNPDKSYKEIWSIKVDGSDLALVVDEEWLYSEKDHWGHINTPPVRSPDNRYIAVIQHKTHLIRSVLRIFDLKNKTSNELFELGGTNAPQWSADGRSLFFRKAGWLTQYDIQTKKLKKIVDLRGYGFFKLTKNGTQFSALNSYKQLINVHDLDGKLIHEVKVNIKSFLSFTSISNDGQFIAYGRVGYVNKRKEETGFININQPNNEMYHIEKSMNDAIISPDNKSVFIYGPRKYEIKTGKVEHLFSPKGMNKKYGRYINLYNLEKWK